MTNFVGKYGRMVTNLDRVETMKFLTIKYVMIKLESFHIFRILRQRQKSVINMITRVLTMNE